MAIIQDWKIRSTRAQCELTGEAFEDGQKFYTCIFEDPDPESDGFIRRDYAVESWEKVKKEASPAPFSFWKSTYKAPVLVVDKKALADTSAEGMLQRFVEEDDPKTENARYILALMLERKKVLVPTDIKETETRKLLFYEYATTGDVVVVADPGLKLAEIESVQMEVAELLAQEEARAASAAAGPEEHREEASESETDDSEEEGDEPAETEE
ncbi:MAG: hypothetical protein P1U81_09225 [Verrucomicrobiales bacterium]|jgi:hypothetical protein|nr:hypothetical protein [Verrucomicrobiales bacterium]